MCTQYYSCLWASIAPVRRVGCAHTMLWVCVRMCTLIAVGTYITSISPVSRVGCAPYFLLCIFIYMLCTSITPVRQVGCVHLL